MIKASISNKSPLEYLRVKDIVRPYGVLPVSRSTWYSWVAQKKAPAGKMLSPGVVVWCRDQVLSVVEAAR